MINSEDQTKNPSEISEQNNNCEDTPQMIQIKKLKHERFQVILKIKNLKDFGQVADRRVLEPQLIE